MIFKEDDESQNIIPRSNIHSPSKMLKKSPQEDICNQKKTGKPIKGKRTVSIARNFESNYYIFHIVCKSNILNFSFNTLLKRKSLRILIFFVVTRCIEVMFGCTVVTKI